MNSAVKAIIFFLIAIAALSGGIFTYQSQQDDLNHSKEQGYDFVTTSGQEYRWKDLTGKWTVINYFAPWCAPCLREMPELNRFNTQLPDDTLIFAINYDRKTRVELEEMANKFDINVPIIFASDATHLPMKKPPYLPATFIIGPDGELGDTLMGEVTEAQLRERITSLKNARKAS